MIYLTHTKLCINTDNSWHDIIDKSLETSDAKQHKQFFEN